MATIVLTDKLISEALSTNLPGLKKHTIVLCIIAVDLACNRMALGMQRSYIRSTNVPHFVATIN